MTFSLFIKIAISIVIAIFVITRRRNNKSAVFDDMEHVRSSDWGGWIEIVNAEYAALFRGKVVTTNRKLESTLLFGVLVEENAPASLVAAIKAGPCAYLSEGLVLVRGFIAHHKKLVMTKLEDFDLIDRLCTVINQGVKPETCLVLNSIEIQHMDTAEAASQFEKLWEDSLDKSRNL